MKIQWKSMYVRCIDRINFLKNLNLLNVQNCENSRKNCVHQMYRQYEFVEKFEFVNCVKIVKIQMKIKEHNKLSKLNGKLITLDVQIVQICFQI